MLAGALGSLAFKGGLHYYTLIKIVPADRDCAGLRAPGWQPAMRSWQSAVTRGQWKNRRNFIDAGFSAGLRWLFDYLRRYFAWRMRVGRVKACNQPAGRHQYWEDRSNWPKIRQIFRNQRLWRHGGAGRSFNQFVTYCNGAAWPPARQMNDRLLPLPKWPGASRRFISRPSLNRVIFA